MTKKPSDLPLPDRPPIAIRYCAQATLAALWTASQIEHTRDGGVRTFDAVTRTWTEWRAVKADDPRMNTVEL